MTVMKRIFVLAFLSFCMLFSMESYGQLLKGFGDKVQKKVENRIERKVERGVDKALDKGEQATDEAAKETVKSSKDKKKEKKESKSDKEIESLRESLPEIEVRPEQLMTLSSSECGSFVWFKKGSVFEYSTSDKSNKYEQQNRMEVKDVYTERGSVVAELEGRGEANGTVVEMDFKYICKGDKLYMDVGEMMKSVFAKNPDLQQFMDSEEAEKVKIDLNNGYMSFPKQLFPGLELDDMVFTFESSMGGVGKINLQVEGLDRVVEARESVTTPAGTFDCMKIRTINSTSFSMMGMNRNLPAQVQYLWISPEVGMVKQESYEKGSLVASMELTKYSL